MSIRLKNYGYFALIPLLVLAVGFSCLRWQAVQYLAAYQLGFGLAKPLPAAVTDDSTQSLACRSQPINVLTYNVRYGSDLIEAARRQLGELAPGGYLPWSLRYPEIQKRIDSYGPDLIGLQEMHTDQDIANIVDLNAYSLLTYHLGQMQYGDAALLYKTQRFDQLDAGQIWLGPDSKLPFSLGFKPLAMIRYANWALLREKDSGFTFLFVNTHFDNNAANREKSSDLFHEQIVKLTERYPMIVVGDFNSNAQTQRYQRLIGVNQEAHHLVNAYDLAFNNSSKAAAPAHPAQLIDHILVGGPCVPEAAAWHVDKRTLASGDTLSDHDPVLATLQFAGYK